MKKIGIDLGTTNSCVYYLDEADNPVLVTDAKGNKIFPSAVYSAGQGEERVVGHKAKARMGMKPSPVIAVKRKMGTDQKVLLGGKEVSPVEVSAEILRHCRKLVETATSDTVGSVVVTVPAYFDAAPMRDTQLAAVQAFFDGDEKSAKGRLELQLEPEAAAYAYLSENRAESLLILVYDLGGGTFDVTVLEKTPEAGLSAIAFGGDPHLGGDNVDDRLASWISYRIRGGKAEALARILAPGHYEDEIRYTVLQQVLANDIAGLRGVIRPEDRDLLIPNPPRYDLELDASNPEDLVRIQKLKRLAEIAKVDLSKITDVAVVQSGVFEDHAGDLIDLDLDLSRNDMNLLIGDMMEKTIRATLAVVEKSGKQRSDFDLVLLVGGSTRMQVVSQELAKIFSCPITSGTANDQDLIVARGAAMRARGLSGAIPSGASKAGGLSLEYPRKTSDKSVNIAGHLAHSMEDGCAYLILTKEGGDKELQNVAVEGDKFLFRGVNLNAGCENRFRIEVLDAMENEVAVADVAILQGQGGDIPRTFFKLTKPIRFLGRRGYKILFPEGEPLPATKSEICYRAGKGNSVLIPIYQGEQPLNDLIINDVGHDVNIGAEIRLTVTIERDYNVRAEAVICNTGQKASVDFRIEPIQMPSLEQLERDKDDALDEIESGMTIIKDPNKRTQFKRTARRLESEFNKALKTNEPDAHHLFTLVGELRKLKVEIVKCQEFLTPPLDEFQGIIRSCRGKASKLEPNAAVTKEDVLKKISALEAAGQDAWDAEDKREWELINKEAEELLRSIIQQGPSGPPPDPAVLVQGILHWLDEIADKARKNGREDEFAEEIQDLRRQTRAVDLSDQDTARDQLIKIVQKKIRPLEEQLKDPNEAVDERDDLTDFK